MPRQFRKTLDRRKSTENSRSERKTQWRQLRPTDKIPQEYIEECRLNGSARFFDPLTGVMYFLMQRTVKGRFQGKIFLASTRRLIERRS